MAFASVSHCICEDPVASNCNCTAEGSNAGVCAFRILHKDAIGSEGLFLLTICLSVRSATWLAKGRAIIIIEMSGKAACPLETMMIR